MENLELRDVIKYICDLCSANDVYKREIDRLNNTLKKSKETSVEKICEIIQKSFGDRFSKEEVLIIAKKVSNELFKKEY